MWLSWLLFAGCLSRDTRLMFEDLDNDGVIADDDCDDGDAGAFPGNPEQCDGVDNNCDGRVDEGLPVLTYFRDADADGYGNGAETTLGCSPPAGYVANAEDCDDTNTANSPAATEICDEQDNDCDGHTDEGVILTGYYDGDGDGFGDPRVQRWACTFDTGYVLVSTDCDDSRDDVHPGAVEVCDEVDNDCDGDTDEDVQIRAYPDNDQDGYGDTYGADLRCAFTAYWVEAGGDCDDSRGDVHPGAEDVCDGLDGDCDGVADDDLFSHQYRDRDQDGYGTSSALYTCPNTAGYAPLTGDCDDNNAAKNPGELEVCDGVDNDCDRDIDEGVLLTVYEDEDSDGYGSSYSDEVCEVTSEWVTTPGDCDDYRAESHPGATEIYYDGRDQDCVPTNEYDQDGDGHDAREWFGDDNLDTDPSCWSVCALGSNRYDPAFDCAEILEDDAAAESGLYWIRAGRPAAWQTSCEMDLDGGGWTLAAYAGDRSGGFPAMYSDNGTFAPATRSGRAVKGALYLARASTEILLAYHSSPHFNGSLSEYEDAVSFVIPNPAAVTLSTAANQGACTAVLARRHLPEGSNRVCVGQSTSVTTDATADCAPADYAAGVWSQSLGGTYSGVGFGYGLFTTNWSCNGWPAISHHWFVGSNITKSWQPSNTTDIISTVDGSTSIWFR